VVRYFTELSNWGRWGPDDRLGTLNLLGAETARRAASLVVDGVTVGLAHPLAPKPTSDYSSEYVHFMTTSGRDLPDEGVGVVADWISLGLHGRVNTHLDAHAHLFWNGRSYNGLAAQDWTAANGGPVGGLEPWFDGVLARGVLVDIPAARGVEAMAGGERVGPDELDAWFDSVGLRPEGGDVLCIRTGRDTWRRRDGRGDDGSYPGLDASCLPWLRRHDVAVLVSDATHDPSPPVYEHVDTPIHAVALTAIGMWLIDNARLDAVAAACAERSRYEFCLSLAPLALKRATGAPVTPFAIF
jgi:kynurenine formamidase